MIGWIATATGLDFDIDNVPLGIYSPRSEAPRPGAATVDFTAAGRTATVPGRAGGAQPLRLADGETRTNGETRTYLEDGKTAIMRGRAVASNRRIGFGELRGTVAG